MLSKIRIQHYFTARIAPFSCKQVLHLGRMTDIAVTKTKNTHRLPQNLFSSSEKGHTMLSVPWQRQSTHSVAYPFVQAQKFWKNAGIIVEGNSKASSSHVLWRHITPRQNCHQQKKSSKHSVNLLRTLTISNVITYRASARWITQNLKCHRVRKAHSCREVSLS